MDIFNPIAGLPWNLGSLSAGDGGEMSCFSELSPDEQRQLLDRSRDVTASGDIQLFIHRLTGQHDL